MFSTTHDAILLIIAAIYVLTAIVRTILLAPLVARGHKPIKGVVTIPILLAGALVTTAVLW